MAPFVIGLKEKRKGERGREEGRKKKKDEVSWGPVPSLLFGTYNLGKELRERREGIGGWEEGIKGKEKKEEQQEITQ